MACLLKYGTDQSRLSERASVLLIHEYRGVDYRERIRALHKPNAKTEWDYYTISLYASVDDTSESEPDAHDNPTRRV